MISEVAEKATLIHELCERFRVETLELFGSAANGDFGPDSDLDFLVEFRDFQVEGAFERYFGLLEGLQELFGRSIDLVMDSAITNPYFRESVDETKVTLYAA